MEPYQEINRRLWNAKTAVHLESAFYDMPAFRAGRSSLNDIELQQLGDISGKKLLHLQCHFGQDTLSLARLGAEVTGIDLSDRAITEARRIAREMDIPARFVCGDVFEADQLINDQFDVIFASYGTIGWLPELNTWGKIINKLLRHDGVFHLIEFHPFIWMFDEDFSGIAYPYFNRGPIEEVTEGSYADRNAPIKNLSVSWPHSFSDVISALLGQGLRITSFKELYYSPYDFFPHFVKSGKGFQIRGLEGMLPLVFALKAER